MHSGAAPHGGLLRKTPSGRTTSYSSFAHAIEFGEFGEFGEAGGTLEQHSEPVERESAAAAAAAAEAEAAAEAAAAIDGGEREDPRFWRQVRNGA